MDGLRTDERGLKVCERALCPPSLRSVLEDPMSSVDACASRQRVASAAKERAYRQEVGVSYAKEMTRLDEFHSTQAKMDWRRLRLD